jgi:hypothetical protein
MKAIKFFMAIAVATLFIISACQKENAGSSISGQGIVASKLNQQNGSATQGTDHVRWDIISLTATPLTARAGGVAFASAITGSALSPDWKIKFTGSGTFVAPTSGGASGAVTGGGTWETFSGGVSTGSGTYTVTKLASWVFANLQLPVLDNQIASPDQVAANGTAVLVIEYSDGSQGTLGVGCHGPGAPDGIEEGVIATKGYVTYWTGEVPGALTVDKNRTLFNIRKKESQ